MRRLPLFASFGLFLLLCASVAYWTLQVFKPPLRPVAAPPRIVNTEVKLDAASTLFGGRAGKTAVASNYQLHGIIMAGRDSVAILSADGKPAQAVRVNKEIAPGVTVKDVQRDYVLLSDGGVTKRVELPESAKAQVGLASNSPVPVQPGIAASVPSRPPGMPSVPSPGSATPTTPSPPTSAAAPATPPQVPPVTAPGTPPTTPSSAPTASPANPAASASAVPSNPTGATVPPSGTTTAPPSMTINPGTTPAQPGTTATPTTSGTPNTGSSASGGIASPVMRQSPGRNLGTQ